MKTMNFVRIEHDGKPTEDWFLLLSLSDLEALEAEWGSQPQGQDLVLRVAQRVSKVLADGKGDPHQAMVFGKGVERDLKAQTQALAHGQPTNHPCFSYLRGNPERKVVIRPYGTYFALTDWDVVVESKESEGFPL